MLLKDFPEDFSLGYSVHVLGLMLQSILIRADQRVDTRAGVMSEEDARAYARLVDLLRMALSDAQAVQRRVMN